MQEYQRLNKARMSYLQQRAKAEWLKGGDENTCYFHACLKKRRMHNQVYRIQNVDGEWKDDNQGIEEAFVQYYKSLLGTDDSSQCKVSESIIKEGPLLSDLQQQNLCVPFTKVDVKAAI